MNNKTLVIIVVIVVLVLATAAVLYKNSTSNTNTNTSTTPTPTVSITDTVSDTPTTTDTPEDDSVQTFNIEAGSFFFKPNVINVKKGDTVKIVLTNNESMQHNFTLDEFNVKTKSISNGTDTVEFTADKVGTFQFYCSIGLHKSFGQVGSLVVTE